MAEIDTALVVRLEASLAKMEKQLARGRASVNETATYAERRFGKMNTEIANTSARAATGLMRVMNISGRGRFVLQNTANQFGDIAVQMQMGTSASKVMAQQLPQLFGGLGALGGSLGLLGPLLGTVAAVGIPLAAMFLRTGKSAETAAKQSEEFAKKVSDAQASVDRARQSIINLADGGLEKLKERYGEVTQKVLDLQKALHDINAGAAMDKVNVIFDEVLGNGLRDKVADAFGAVGGAIVTATEDDKRLLEQMIADLEQQMALMSSRNMPIMPGMEEQLSQMRQELAAINLQFDQMGSLADGVSASTLDAAGALQDAFDRVSVALENADPAGVADGISDILALAEAAGVTLDKGMVTRLREAEDLARQAANELNESAAAATATASAAGNIASALAPGVAQAEALANALGTSVARANHLAALEAQIQHDRIDKRFAPEADAMSQSLTPVPITQAMRDRVNPPATTRSRGGGGGGSRANTLDELTRKYEALRAQLDPTFRAAQQLEEAQTTLNEAYKAGLITQSEYIDLLAKSAEEYGVAMAGAAEAADFFSNATFDALKGLILEGQSLSDVFDNLALAIAEAALQAALLGTGPFANLFGMGDSGGALGMIFGSLFQGFATGGATGGNNPSRVAGVVHEKEFVFDAAATARIGVANLEALRRGTMPGFMSGGYVGASSSPSRGGSVVFAPEITIDNRSSAQIDGSIEETVGASGQRSMKLVLADQVGASLTQPGGGAKKVLGSRYGVRQRGTRR